MTAQPGATRASPRRKRVLAFVFAGVLFASLLARKIVEYSADPVAPKDCVPDTQSRSAISSRPVAIPTRASDVILPFVQRGGTLNDASCLNRTLVFGVVKVKSETDIKRALQFARENRLKISVAGARHSMGGQAFLREALVLDMTDFNRLAVDVEHKMLTAQSGATWQDVQALVHSKGLAVKSMQSIEILTIGGAISVNAHSIDHRTGAIASTIRAMRVMLADGSVRTTSREQEPELFRAVIGGYGLFGVVLDAQIELTENAMYERHHQVMDYRDFPAVYERVAGDDRSRLAFAQLSTAPRSFLREMILTTYGATEGLRGPIPPTRRGEYQSWEVPVQRLQDRRARPGTQMVAHQTRVPPHHSLPRLEESFTPRARGLPGVPQPGDARRLGRVEEQPDGRD